MTEYKIGDRKVGEYGERMSKRKSSNVWILDPPYDNDICPDCGKGLDERDVDIVHWKGYLYHIDCFRESHKQVSFY